MLGFILSKMQMMLFAVGILVVALMFLNFISGLELKEITSGTLESQIQIISGQFKIDNLCSFKTITIPEFFEYGMGTSNRLYYDLLFSKIVSGSGSDMKTKLVIVIREHAREGRENKAIIYDAKNIMVDGEVILIDPGFIESDDFIENFYDEEQINLYPRASNKDYAPPNAFVALKRIKDEKKQLFIIPCSTLAKSFTDVNNNVYYLNNCEENILRAGCQTLKEENASPSNNDRIPQCFEIDREIVEEDYYTVQTRELTWKDCKEFGYVRG